MIKKFDSKKIRKPKKVFFSEELARAHVGLLLTVLADFRWSTSGRNGSGKPEEKFNAYRAV
jgi:hypothetical protein